jgi:hypothetical protein
MYVAVMLLTFLVPYAVVMIAAWRVRPSKALVRGATAAALIVLPIAVLLGVTYLRGRSAHGERGWTEILDGSASPSNYGDAHIRLVSYRWQSGRGHRIERELMPGASTVALAAAGIIPPLTAGGIATLVAGALAFDWSLGLKGLTYDDLYRRSAVYRGMRVPARFGAIVDAALAMLAAYGARRLLRSIRTPPARALACAVICAAVLIDLRMDPGLSPYWTTVPSIYSRVTPDMVLVELPIEHQTDYMYFSTRHWARLLGGYSGYPGYSAALLDGYKAFPGPTSIDDFRRAGATHLTYNCALEDVKSRCGRIVEMLDSSAALTLIASERWERGDVRLYRLN